MAAVAEFASARDQCFLCRRELNSTDLLTREHVFPRWLQNRYQLWEKQLGLLNHTRINYRQLVIPCCAACNQEHLSRLEHLVRGGVARGFDEFRRIDPRRLHQWLAKIFFGLLFRELSLKLDQADPHSDSIVDLDMINSYSVVRMFLQGIRLDVTTEGPPEPWSVFLCRTAPGADVASDFDYLDNVACVAGIRMSEVGAIVCFDDAGIVKRHLGPQFRSLDDVSLEPLQFTELVAAVIYLRRRLLHPPNWLYKGPRDASRMTLVPHTHYFCDCPEFGPPDVKEWVELFAQYLVPHRLGVKDIFNPPNRVRSFLAARGDYVTFPA
jgi:hypothetical protein